MERVAETLKGKPEQSEAERVALALVIRFGPVTLYQSDLDAVADHKLSVVQQSANETLVSAEAK